jgi:hypothetical protein
MRPWPHYNRTAYWLRRAGTAAEAAFLLAAGAETEGLWPAEERHRIFDDVVRFFQEALAVARGEGFKDDSWRMTFLWAAEALLPTRQLPIQAFGDRLSASIAAAERARDGKPLDSDEQEGLTQFLRSLARVAQEEEESAARGEPYDRWSKMALQTSLP